jgi:hypothetical protein
MVRYHHRVGLAIALTLALAASLAPLALADPQPLAGAEAAIAANQSPATPPIRPNADEQNVPPSTTTAPCSDACSGHGYGNPAPGSVAGPTEGFHWDDAGIGAGTAFALTVLLAAVAFTTTKTRRRATRSSAQPTT